MHNSEQELFKPKYSVPGGRPFVHYIYIYILHISCSAYWGVGSDLLHISCSAYWGVGSDLLHISRSAYWGVGSDLIARKVFRFCFIWGGYMYWIYKSRFAYWVKSRNPHSLLLALAH